MAKSPSKSFSNKSLTKTSNGIQVFFLAQLIKTMALTGRSKIPVTFLDNEAKKKIAFGAFG